MLPARKQFFNFFPEVRSKQQVLRLLWCFKSCSYVIQEYTTDNTTTTPHTGNGCQIEIPTESIGCLLQYSKTLCIRYQFGSIQGRINILHQFRFIIYHLRTLASELLGSRFTQIFLCRKATLKNSRSNQSQGHSQFHSIDNRPFTSTFLSGSIQNLINQISTCLIFMT